MITFAGLYLLATMANGPSYDFSWPGLALPRGEPPKVMAALPKSSGELLETRPADPQETVGKNWCQSGYMVMIPDGREGRVTSTDGDTCKVLAYGEAYVSIWTYDLIEPVYPQELNHRNFGH